MKALLQQALEALESVLPPLVTPEIAKAIPAVRTAIKQAEQAQPVGVLQEGGRMHGITYTCLWSDLPAGTPLYTHPQPSKPLSEEQIKAGLAAHGLKTLWPSQLSDAFRLGIKFAESHCGIKEQS